MRPGYMAAAVACLSTAAAAQQQPAMTNMAASAPAAPMTGVFAPADTLIQVTPIEDITSKHMKVGDVQHLQVVNDVVENGVVVIPRGAPVTGTITWHTGKAIGGKSAKFDLTFNSVRVHGQDYALKGKFRQEGKGNTVAALLGSMLISGHSAVMTVGQMVPVFTAVPIPAS